MIITVLLGRAVKMYKILNMKNQEYFQIIADKVKGEKRMKKAILALERIP